MNDNEKKRVKFQEPKTTLEDLEHLLMRSASDPNLDEAQQKLAARVIVLTRHERLTRMIVTSHARVHQAVYDRLDHLDQGLAEVAERLAASLRADGAASADGAADAASASAVEAAADADAAAIAAERDAATRGAADARVREQRRARPTPKG